MIRVGSGQFNRTTAIAVGRDREMNPTPHNLHWSGCFGATDLKA